MACWVILMAMEQFQEMGIINKLQATSIHKKFLIDIKLMLQTLGIHSKVTISKHYGESLLPDGKGGKKVYKTKQPYRILITSVEVQKLLQLGFETMRLSLVKHEPNRNAMQFIKVVKVEDKNRYDDTYCFSEKKRHMGVFEGILTGQCNGGKWNTVITMK